MAEAMDDTMPSFKPHLGVEPESVSVLSNDRQRTESVKTSVEEELQSLEYEEDCFYLAETTATPSFDDVTAADWSERSDGAYWTMDPEVYSESELHLSDDDESSTLSLSPPKPRPPRFLILRSGHLVKRVRVSWQQWLRVRRSKSSSFLKAVKERVAKARGEEPPLTITPDESDLQGMTEEEKEKQREIWQKELAEVEEEIEALKSVLKSKVRLSQELKRKLGFTVWRELSQDFSQGVKTVKETAVYQTVEGGLSNLGKAVVESPVYHTVEDKFSQVKTVVADNAVYQRTESVVKATADTTKSIIGGLTGGFTHKLGQIKNSESFRSLEDKVGSAYENVKTKVSSRSSSIQSFDDALREETGRHSVTSPTIPEGKPVA